MEKSLIVNGKLNTKSVEEKAIFRSSEIEEYGSYEKGQEEKYDDWGKIVSDEDPGKLFPMKTPFLQMCFFG